LRFLFYKIKEAEDVSISSPATGDWYKLVIWGWKIHKFAK